MPWKRDDDSHWLIQIDTLLDTIGHQKGSHVMKLKQYIWLVDSIYWGVEKLHPLRCAPRAAGARNICVGFTDVTRIRRESGTMLRAKFAYDVRHVHVARVHHACVARTSRATRDVTFGPLCIHCKWLGFVHVNETETDTIVLIVNSKYSHWYTFLKTSTNWQNIPVELGDRMSP
jgi:hypothetical protein